jgi:uncharacterized SAM-binding protein YcdF (DUF218 family)
MLRVIACVRHPAISRLTVFRSRWFFWGPLGLLLLAAILLISPLVPAVAAWLTDEWREPDGEILIVLAAEQLGDGTIGISSYWRSVYAARAWRRGATRKVLICGGRLAGTGRPAISAVMAEFLISQGVPRHAIILEERSFSTRENALGAAGLLRGEPGRKALLTSDCHMRRARRTFARVGLEVIPAPIPDVGKRWNSWADRPACVWMVGVELVKLAHYARLGWI